MTAPTFTRSPGRAALYRDDPKPGEVATYSVAEVAQMMGIGEQTLRDAIKRGECPIPHLRFLSRIRFAKNAVHAALSA